MNFDLKPSNENILGAEISYKQALESAVKTGANLVGINLCGVNLSGINLTKVDLHKVNLSWANLTEANFSYAKLENANLFYATLTRAKLRGTRLSGSNLANADLSYVDFTQADLRETIFSYANLANTNFSRANLARAALDETTLFMTNLAEANLDETVLDPKRNPNGNCENFKALDKDWVLGYRTRQTSAAGEILIDDRIYGAEIFSTCETECHPGWYLWPTLEAAIKFSGGEKEFIEVKARKIDIHRAGTKWRSRAIWVIRSIKN